MAKNGRLIQAHFGSKPLLLALYYDKGNVVYDAPPGTKHLAHVTYLKPKASSEYWRSGIDYFLVENGSNVMGLVSNKNEPLHISNRRVSSKMNEINSRQGVRFNLMGDIKGTELEGVVKLAALKDIYLHTYGAKLPMIRSEPSFGYVDQIRSDVQLRRELDIRVDPEGKQSFFPGCALDLNLDFAKWCVAAVTKDFKLAPWNDCLMCYASYKHEDFPSVAKVDVSALREQIQMGRAIRTEKGLPTRFMRLGKRTEAAADIFRDHLLMTFEACEKEGLSIVLPTKFLRYDPEIAEGLKRTNSTLLISLGNDKFEMGPAALGFTNNFRFEQGLLYQEAGVRTVPYSLVDAKLEDGGPEYSPNLLRALKAFKQVQILPVRSRHRFTAGQILKGWHSLLGPLGKDLFGHSIGGYENSRDSTKIAHTVHKSLLDRVGNNDGNVRMCHHNSHTTYCGGCFMSGICGVVEPRQKTITVKREDYDRVGGKVGANGAEVIIIEKNVQNRKLAKPKDRLTMSLPFLNSEEEQLLAHYAGLMAVGGRFNFSSAVKK